MVESFKRWFQEIREDAVKEKMNKARMKGDESKWKKEIWRSPDKNRAIKERFCAEGTRLKYESRPCNKTHSKEWLYDFVWREFDSQRNLKRVILAMEIEVSDQYFNYDFSKLLQADSEYKIMVFQVKLEQEVEKVFQLLSTAVLNYQSKTASNYLLVGWCTSLNDFIFKHIEVITPE